jgi:hypothetical protein
MSVVSDIEADDGLEALGDLDVESVEFSDWSATPKVTIKDSKNEQTQKIENLSPSEFRLLQVIVNHPMLPSSHYVKLARVSPNTLRKLRPLFIEQGFIEEHSLDSAGRGRSTRVWEPLQAAKDIVSAGNADQEE